MSIVKVNFQDQGQDLLYFEVDTIKLLVIDAGPYHSSIYKGAKVLSKIIEGDFITIESDQGYQKVKYPITEIEVIK